MNIQQARAILGMTGEITEDSVKKAFKKKAHKSHPDKGGNNGDFIRITEARDVLLQSTHNTSNIFETLFGERRPFRKTQTQLVDVSISLQEGYWGGVVTKTAMKSNPCPECGGLGRAGAECVHCHGDGYTTMQMHRGGVHILNSKKICGYCCGTGFSQKCETCGGKGLLFEQEEIKIKVEPGTIQDTVITAEYAQIQIRVHIDIPENYRVGPGAILFSPKISLDDVINGYDIEMLGKKFKIAPFSFNKIILSNDFILLPNIFVDNKQKYTDLLLNSEG